MRAGVLPRDPGRLAELDRRARRVPDPVQRLRYLRRAMAMPPAPALQPGRRIAVPLLAFLLLLVCSAPTGSSARAGATPASPPSAPAAPLVWLVQADPQFELYSNGLRIERSWLTHGPLRRPRRLPRREPAAVTAPDPAGVVFHASENDPAPFLPEHNQRLTREGENLLAWVRRHGLYHYLIDRFGRVYRIREDQERAHHAGQSVWADAHWIYLDLNESFLGVCFEASTTEADPRAGLNPAQLHAGRVLIEMLRCRYRLPAENFVTHAQVSVRASNWRIGYHTDWADGFPFAELGLPDNYAQPLPSLLLFGFQADSMYARRAGPRLREALEATERLLARQAEACRLSPAGYRRSLQQRYRRALARSPGA